MSGSRFKLVDLVLSFVLIVFMAGWVAADMAQSAEIANRIKCASNLRQIGQAMLIYANDNRGSCPRTNWAPGDDPKPAWGTPYQADPSLGANASVDPFVADGKPESKYRPEPNDVTAAMFLLLREGDITSDVFVCPSSEAEQWDFGGGTNTALSWTNFKGNNVLAGHLSYSFNNPYFSNTAVAAGLLWNSSISADYALAGDLNPGTDDLVKLTTRSPMAEMRRGNSPNHFQEGQNLLFGDGHVEFDQNPFAGSKRDNIYTFEAKDQPENDKSASAGVIGAPIAIDDSVLLPTAQSIGHVLVQPVTADQTAAFQKKLAGAYSRIVGGRTVHLTLTDTTLSEQMPGLVPVPYSYEIKGTAGDHLRIAVTAPNAKPTSGRIDFTADGVKISRCGAFSGDWKRD